MTTDEEKQVLECLKQILQVDDRWRMRGERQFEINGYTFKIKAEILSTPAIEQR